METYELILSERVSGLAGKDVGDQVFFAELPVRYAVFVLSYPAAMPDAALESGLRKLGDQTGENVFVNIGRLNDPDFDRITSTFGIDRYPVVIITGTAEVAGAPDQALNSYVRVDNKYLLKDADRAVRLVTELALLFLQGDIVKAIKREKWADRTQLARVVGSAVVRGLRHMVGFVADRDISVSVVEGKFELKRSGR